MPKESGDSPELRVEDTKKTVVITMFTHKGGVGKTTGTENLAGALALKGARVLLVDADPQCNLSKDFIKAKVASHFPHFPEEILSKVQRKVARLFTKWGAKDEMQFEEYSVHVVAALKSQDEIEALFPDRDVSKDFILYQYQQPEEPAEESSEGALSDDERFEWYLYGETSSGEKQHLKFDEQFLEALEEDGMDEADTGCEDKLSFEVKRKLLLHATAELGHMGYDLEEAFQALVNCRLVTEDDISVSHDDLGNGFVLSKKDGVWVFYHYIKGSDRVEVKPEALHPGVAKLLKSHQDLNPSALSDEDQALLKKYLSSYLFVNFSEAYNFKAVQKNKTAARLRDRVNRVSLLEIKPEDMNPGLADGGHGAVLLLPGCDSLLLDLGRLFSFGIQGLKSDFFASYSESISMLNHFIRDLADRCDADVVVVDLSPSADDFNSTLMMTSDYFLTTVNPEAFSDDAMGSLHTILSRWRVDFSALYSDKDGGEFYPIDGPPQALGYFLQKMPMKGDQLQSEISREIAGEIKTVFDTEIVPLLRSKGMYPSFGIKGFDASGKAESDRIPHDIPKFTKHEIASQYAGHPVVWSGEESLVYHSAYERVLSRTIGHAIVNDPRFSSRLKEAFRDLERKQEEKKEKEFSDKWSRYFCSAYERQTVADRQRHIADPYYRLDYMDMLVLIRSIRSDFVGSSGESRLHAKKALFECSSRDADNSAGVLLLDPCISDEINAKLSDALTKIESQWDPKTILSCIIIPYFTGEYWMCARVEISQRSKIISVLFDDPHGGVFNKHDRVPGDKRTKVRNVIPPRMVRQVMKSVESCVTSYLRKRSGQRHYQLHSRGFMCKHVDQVGYLANDTDSGIVVLVNIEDYLKQTATGKLYSNRAYERTADLYKAKGVLADHNLDNYTNDEDDQELDLPAEMQNDGLYSLGEYRYDYRSKSKKAVYSTPEIRKERKRMGVKYKKLVKLFEELNKVKGAENKKYLRYYGDYIRGLLMRVPLDRRGHLRERVFDAHPGLRVGQFMSDILLKIFFPPKPTRNNPYGEGEKFRGDVFKSVFETYAKKKAALLASPRTGKGKGPRKQLPSVDSGSGKSSPLRKMSFFSASLQAPKAVYALSSDPSTKFDCYDVSSDGDCGYSSFGITREKAHELLDDMLDDPIICGLLRHAVLEQMIKEEFIDYLQAHLLDSEGIVEAFQTYLRTQQIAPLEKELDEDDGNILQSYLEYDIVEKSIDAGWCHPSVLQALAHATDSRIRMWKKNDDSKLIPYKPSLAPGDHGYDDFNSDKPDCIDVLFVNGNHFEKLMPHEEAANQAGPAATPRSASRAFDFTDSEDDDPSFDAAVTTRKRQGKKMSGSRSKREKRVGEPAAKSSAPNSSGSARFSLLPFPSGRGKRNGDGGAASGAKRLKHG